MHMAMHHHDDEGGETFGLHDSRPLYVMTGLLGLLILLDVLLPITVGWSNQVYGMRLALIAAVLGGARVLYSSLELAFEGNIGGDFALAIACIAAIIVGEPVVAAEVVFIGMVGESLEAITFGCTRKELRSLLELRPHHASAFRDGRWIILHTEELVVGDRVLVRPGERIPADGKVVSGNTEIDQGALTGESIPVEKSIGDDVFTGTLNQNGSIEFIAERVGHETTFGRLLELIEEAQTRKAPIEKTADRYARWFLPIVLVCALGTYLVTRDVMRAVAVLVVACPCGLILATPAAVLAAVARLARLGVVLRGGLAIERLARADAIAFDKTGTLTEGKPALADVLPLGGRDEREVLWCAATAEQHSEHVFAGVVVAAAKDRGLESGPLERFEAFPGAGVEAQSRGERLLVGNRRLIERFSIPVSETLEENLAQLDQSGQTGFVVVRGSEPIGVIGVRDRLRPEAAGVIADLRSLGFEKIALVTGDRSAVANAVARLLAIGEALAEQLPTDKAAFVERWRKEGRRVAMIGDGINDAPALAVSDVGLALGGVGTNIAAEAGDIVLMRDPLAPLPFSIRLARQTLRVIRQNIVVFAFVVNATAILLSGFGVLPPIGAAIYHQIGSFLVLLNAMRLLFFESWDALPFVKTMGEWDRRLSAAATWFNPIWIIDFGIRRCRGIAATAVALGIVWYLFSGFVVIDANEVGVLKRFGKVRRHLEPGLHGCLPPPFDQVQRVRPDEIQSIEIGYRRSRSIDPAVLSDLTVEWNSPHRDGLILPEPEESLMLTGDESLVEINATVLFRIADVDKALFAVGDPRAALASSAESVFRMVAAETTEDELLTTGRRRIEDEVKRRLTLRIGPSGCDLGLDVVSVALTDVHPPRLVVPDYHAVSSAMEDRERSINQAEAYRNGVRLTVEGEATEKVSRAAGEGVRGVELAKASAESFLAQYDASRTSPPLTRAQLYWEMIEAALAGRSKIVLDPDASGRRQVFLGNSGASLPAPTVLPALSPPAEPPSEQ